MLQITIPGTEFFDEAAGQFIITKDTMLTLEHSLVSLSKWEAKWQIPFLTNKPKTIEQSLDYIRCMTIRPDPIDQNVYRGITQKQIEEIYAYIDNPMTATTFSQNPNEKPNRQIVTAEIIYYWMVSLQIPFECQKWHLNRLLTLIRVINIKNAPSKKMSKRDLMNRNRSLNAARRAKSGSRG